MAGVTNEPPAATVAPETASELTVLPMPEPSADQVVPSHLAMRLAGLPPGGGKGAADIKIAAGDGECVSGAAQSGSQRGPSTAVPFGDIVCGRNRTGDGESS